MKRILPFLAVAGMSLAGVATSYSAIFAIDLSPGPGRALNLGASTYTRDHATGLSGLNETGMFAASGSGNEIGAGISYNDVSNVLSFDMAYGSAFGFADLLGNLTVLHVHGAGLVNFPAANTSAGVQFDLAGFHTASGPRSGRITGTRVLTAAQETMLLNNSLYVNIHSAAQTGGEIRGQLIIVPEPSQALLALISFVTVAIRRRR